MKDNKTEETAAQPITAARIEEILTALATALGMSKADGVSSTQYGQLIALTWVKLNLIPQEAKAAFLAGALASWEFIPKNPSAMRQKLFDKPAAAQAKTIDISKFMDM